LIVGTDCKSALSGYVSAKDYQQGGIRDKKGKLLKNQVLVIEGVFSGGHSEGDKVVQGGENGTEADSREVPIPNGMYDILDNKGGKYPDYLRLDPQDSYRYNDEHEQSQNNGSDRKNFRFHLGRVSWGCVTMNKDDSSSDRDLEWNVITQIFSNTSTTNIPDRQGRQKLNPFSQRTNYGTMEVKGTTINSKKAPNSRPINISPTVLAPVGY
jgi:hypothetical protein